MQSFSITRHSSGWPQGQSVAGIASVVAAVVVVALLIAWVVAASLGLGVEGQPAGGPDRPPAPLLA